MLDDLHIIAQTANRNSYNSDLISDYINGAPHLKHKTIFKIYKDLVFEAYTVASTINKNIRVLDLGCGDGLATVEFLKLGCSVTAVDISEQQLNKLKSKCLMFENKIEIHCGDIFEFFAENQKFDLIVANSLLHHIPDYSRLIELIIDALKPGGVFLSFQDPVYRGTLTFQNRILDGMAYLYWRIRQGDLLLGVMRKLRRIFGYYSPNSIHDNSEYHAVRKGVNQVKIQKVLDLNGCKSRIVYYPSFHDELMQKLGEKINLNNNFAIFSIKNN